jgi:hypothetical protein
MDNFYPFFRTFILDILLSSFKKLKKTTLYNSFVIHVYLIVINQTVLQDIHQLDVKYVSFFC